MKCDQPPHSFTFFPMLYFAWRSNSVPIFREDEPVVSREQPGEAHELGMPPTRARQTVHEQQAGARRGRAIQVGAETPALGVDGDFLDDDVRLNARDP